MHSGSLRWVTSQQLRHHMVLIPDIFENALWTALEWQKERHPPFIPGPNVLPLASALYVDSPQVSVHPSSYEPFLSAAGRRSPSSAKMLSGPSGSI